MHGFRCLSSKETPQFPQYLAFAEFASLHFLQRTPCSDDPHSPQNFTLGGFRKLHFLQGTFCAEDVALSDDPPDVSDILMKK